MTDSSKNLQIDLLIGWLTIMRTCVSPGIVVQAEVEAAKMARELFPVVTEWLSDELELCAAVGDLNALRSAIERRPIDWQEVGYLRKQLAQSLETLKRTDLEARACEVPV